MVPLWFFPPQEPCYRGLPFPVGPKDAHAPCVLNSLPAYFSQCLDFHTHTHPITHRFSLLGLPHSCLKPSRHKLLFFFNILLLIQTVCYSCRAASALSWLSSTKLTPLPAFQPLSPLPFLLARWSPYRVHQAPTASPHFPPTGTFLQTEDLRPRF